MSVLHDASTHRLEIKLPQGNSNPKQRRLVPVFGTLPSGFFPRGFHNFLPRNWYYKHLSEILDFSPIKKRWSRCFIIFYLLNSFFRNSLFVTRKTKLVPIKTPLGCVMLRIAVLITDILYDISTDKYVSKSHFQALGTSELVSLHPKVGLRRGFWSIQT